jgi:hypothetical protein
MNDFVIAQIRTWVPVAIGAALTYLAAKLGVVIDEDISGQVAAVAVTIVTGVYYLLVSALARKWSAFGWLLGYAKAPTYGVDTAAPGD